MSTNKNVGPSRRYRGITILLLCAIAPTMLFCNSGKNAKSPLGKAAPAISKDSLEIYIPKELREQDFKDDKSKWSYSRSSQSAHFIVFWDIKYGGNQPNSIKIPPKYRVDIADLLKKAEAFYDLNVNKLHFAVVGKGKSNLDRYKMLIFLYYQDEWLATGSGYDDVIGALWVNPSTVQPAGSVLAHEIGHCFQYQVNCDQGGESGFRYGFGGKPNNVFWEQTAQWQSFQSFPGEIFTSNDFNEYMENRHRHIHHEDQRYASYFIHYYWTEKHGLDMIGKIWRMARKPEDPVQTYMRITGIKDEKFNDEVYDAATRFATWDLNSLRTLGRDYIGRQRNEFEKCADGSLQVKPAKCPGTTGYNIVPLKVPETGTVVSAEFTGIVNANGYNHSDSSRAGWRYGYVALLKNGTRIYSPMYSQKVGMASFTIPADCSRLWLVVTGAPITYAQHGWDDDNSNDEQWPYRVRFKGTTWLGE